MATNTLTTGQHIQRDLQSCDARAFDVERVTKRFYDRFKLEHADFLHFIQGIPSQTGREWYAII